MGDPDGGLPATQVSGDVTSYDGDSAQQILASVRKLEVTAKRSIRGPLPRPDTLKEFENVLPGSAERILRMAEKEQDHRHRMLKRLIVAETRTAVWGLVFALIVALAFLAAAVWLVSIDHTIEGTLLGTADVVALATVFIIGRQSQGDALLIESDDEVDG